MAKKTKQQKNRARRTSSSIPGGAGLAQPQLDAGEGPSFETAPRRVERVDPVTRKPAGSFGMGVAVAALDPEEAAIPLDRVPYAMSDLRRVGVMALMMVILIIVADVVVSKLFP